MKGKAFLFAFGLVALALFGGGADAQCTVPATCGQWEGPFDLDVSCPVAAPCFVDEIVHAALIPTGVHAGDVIFWTRCQGFRGSCNPRPPGTNPYTSHILRPSDGSLVAHPSFHAAYGLDPLVDDLVDGPFCSGHTWMLDQDESPKLLVAGGLNGTTLGSRETLWFDPITATWLDGPGALPPLDMKTGASWYPSVLTFLDHARTPPRFRPIAVGGTTEPGGQCSQTYSGWWTMELPAAGNPTAPQWTAVEDPDGFKWPSYPRARFLHTDSGQGEIITAGQDRVCVASDPCQKILTASNPQTHQEFVQAEGVGAWHENNAVLQHTLRPSWTWNTDTPLDEYQLNRLFGLMGAQTNQTLGLVETRELVRGSILGLGPETPIWREKADAPVGRVFSNAVVLPDGSIIIVGGQNNVEAGGEPDTLYRFSADRFDPQNPLESGSWTSLAESNLVGFNRTPRGYHSAAMLLSDGSVLLMGGQNDSTGIGLPPSDDTVEIFKPPYFFNGSRPVLGNPGATIRYGQTFLVNLTVPLGRQIDRFCLVGVASVTHGYDAGQRYIELIWRNPPPSGSGQATNQREVLAPPVADMAPEGYYLLFGLDSTGVPSLGRFVKLTF